MKLETRKGKTRTSLRPTAVPGAGRLSLASCMCLPLLVQAADANPNAAVALDVVKVESTAIDPNPNAEPGVPYKARRSGDERHSRPLADTPQTITVLTKAQIDDSGYTDLRQILAAQPGITLGTGENGNAFGDRYIIRGQEARSDVFVDGLRDPGMSIRESFATEQVEISKGPNSSFAGRGTSGGAVNSVSKQASFDYDFTKLSTGFGSDRDTRLTLDSNQLLNAQNAVRVNLLHSDQDVPNRAPAQRKRQGAALSWLTELTKDLSLVIDYYGLRAKDRPDLGSYLVGTVPNRQPKDNVPVYAQRADFLTSDIDTVTARLSYQLSPTMRLSNLTRYGTAQNGYVTTGARSALTGNLNPGGVYETAMLSTHQGWQEVRYLANQSNLSWQSNGLGFRHEWIASLEFTDHHVVNGNYTVTNSGQNCISGNGATLNAWCVFDKDGAVVNGLDSLLNRQISKGTWDIDWHVKTTALSLMDTVTLAPAWTAFAGVRLDRFDFDTVTQSANGVESPYRYASNLVNGNLGLTWAFHPEAKLYLSYATASDINGGESDVGSSCGYGGICVDTANGVAIADSRPEISRTIELGSKWNLMDGKLLATAAVFQITKSDVMEQSPGSSGYTSSGAQNTGKNRVRGFEWSLVGRVSDRLTAQAAVTLMKSEVLASNVAANIGKTLSNFADKSASAQLNYQLTPALSLGGAVRYASQRYAGQPDSAAAFDAADQYSQPIPAYTVVDLFATYRVNKNVDLRLNIGNVADKTYYLAGYRSGSFLYKGDARHVRLTVNTDF